MSKSNSFPNCCNSRIKICTNVFIDHITELSPFVDMGYDRKAITTTLISVLSASILSELKYIGTGEKATIQKVYHFI